MSSYNLSTLIGRLGADPEIRHSQDGTAYGVVRLATSETWKDKSTGERKERSDWHRIKVSGRLAEICGEYLKKGDLALFSGQLRTDKYTDKNGVEKYDTHVRANEMKMLITKRDDEAPRDSESTRGGGPTTPRGDHNKTRPDHVGKPASESFEDDDIPFATNRGMW